MSAGELSRAQASGARLWFSEPRPRDALMVTAVALVLRLLTVLWAAGRFPPADDGHFYHIVATRIANGLGYTWLWPDGAVTYAAHYPVGYPALIGGVYALVGSTPTAAMALNAVLGALGAGGVYWIAATLGLRGPALVAGSIAALHPGFVFYTPALMTEGVTGALLSLSGAACVLAAKRAANWRWLLLVGLLCGLTALVRPQVIVLAPLFGVLASAMGPRARLSSAAVVTAVAIAVCLPWTLRNCSRLDRCVFVSANGGWNLFIGSAEGATGRWVALDRLGVPAECREVYAEAAKDQCFGRAGVRNIATRPAAYLALVPRKLAATFDFTGAPGHYLRASNPQAFSDARKVVLGAAQALVERLVVLLGLIGVARAAGALGRLRLLVAAAGIPWLFLEHAWVAHAALVVAASLGGLTLLRRPTVALGVGVVFATAVTHAVFFGDGRYGLPCGLLLVALAAEAFRPKQGSAEAATPASAVF